MQPIPGAYPFPPPPLDFPDIDIDQNPSTTDDIIDIEIVALQLSSSQPLQVSPPLPTGQFNVDSFFDIEYRIQLDGDPSSQFQVDSFFDISY